MTTKLSRKQIENGLDALLLKIITERQVEDLERLRVGLYLLEKLGYPLKGYREIYEELRQDFEDYGLIPKTN